MKYLRHIYSVTVLCGMAASAARAADVKVIANSSVTASHLSADELKGVFTITKMVLSDGSRVEPVILRSGATHAAFLKSYLGKTDIALETYYRSLVFTGKASMPKSVASDAEMVEYVSKTKRAIGYVSGAANTAGVKTLEVQ